MANFYGNPSGYLKKKEFRHSAWEKIILLILIVATVVVLVNINRLGASAFIFLVILIAGIAKILDPIIRRHKKRSNQYYRGRMGEYKIKDELANLSEDYSVFKDVILNSDRGNIDYVIVGPGGVYVLEVKSHSGNIGFNGTELTNNDKLFEKDFLKQAKSEALQVHDFLKANSNIDIYVKPVIIFSGYASMRFGLKPIDGVYVIGKSFLQEFFDKQPVINFLKQKVEELIKK